MQRQAFERLKKALWVLADAAQFDAQVTDQLSLFGAFGVQLGAQLFAHLGLAIGQALLVGGCAQGSQGRFRDQGVLGLLRQKGFGGGFAEWLCVVVGQLGTGHRLGQGQGVGRLGAIGHAPGAKGVRFGFVPLGAQENRGLALCQTPVLTLDLCVLLVVVLKPWCVELRI